LIKTTVHQRKRNTGMVFAIKPTYIFCLLSFTDKQSYNTVENCMICVKFSTNLGIF